MATTTGLTSRVAVLLWTEQAEEEEAAEMVILPASPHDDPKLMIEDRALRLLIPPTDISCLSTTCLHHATCC